MLLSAASATMKPFFVTSIGNVLLNMQSDSVRIDIDIAGSPWPDYYASLGGGYASYYYLKLLVVLVLALASASTS